MIKMDIKIDDSEKSCFVIEPRNGKLQGFF